MKPSEFAMMSAEKERCKLIGPLSAMVFAGTPGESVNGKDFPSIDAAGKSLS